MIVVQHFWYEIFQIPSLHPPLDLKNEANFICEVVRIYSIKIKALIIIVAKKNFVYDTPL